MYDIYSGCKSGIWPLFRDPDEGCGTVRYATLPRQHTVSFLLTESISTIIRGLFLKFILLAAISLNSIITYPYPSLNDVTPPLKLVMCQ